MNCSRCLDDFGQEVRRMILSDGFETSWCAYHDWLSTFKFKEIAPNFVKTSFSDFLLTYCHWDQCTIPEPDVLFTEELVGDLPEGASIGDRETILSFHRKMKERRAWIYTSFH